MEFALAAFLRPFILFALAITVLYPARCLVSRYMRDGKYKKVLLSRDPGVLIAGAVVGYVLIVVIALSVGN